MCSCLHVLIFLSQIILRFKPLYLYMFCSIVHTCVVYTVFTKHINFITGLFLKNKDFYHLKKNQPNQLIHLVISGRKKTINDNFTGEVN